MNFLNIGAAELMLILLIALIVVGPRRLPEIGRNLGKIMNDLRKISQEFTTDLTRELEAPAKELTEIAKELEAPAKELTEMAKELEAPAKELTGMTRELEAPAKELKEIVEQDVSDKAVNGDQN
jgi:Tat protein translocase TatB subunit